jgi:predicted acylesterase/phospholipase RssA
MARRAAHKKATPRGNGAAGNAASNVARPPGQIVLVLQGGGALGAYQIGVYQAMHEAGIEPDWVIGTSIGAINAAIIAGNEPKDRLGQMHAFWDVEPQHHHAGCARVLQAEPIVVVGSAGGSGCRKRRVL